MLVDPITTCRAYNDIARLLTRTHRRQMVSVCYWDMRRESSRCILQDYYTMFLDNNTLLRLQIFA